MKTKVNERLWWAVKTLLKGGSMIKDAAEYFGVSQNTVSRINQSESYEEYKNIIAANHKSYQKKSRLPGIDERIECLIEETDVKKPESNAQPPAQTVIYKPTWEMMQEMQKTNDLLKMISAKLAFIVDELCGVGKKED